MLSFLQRVRSRYAVSATFVFAAAQCSRDEKYIPGFLLSASLPADSNPPIRVGGKAWLSRVSAYYDLLSPIGVMPGMPDSKSGGYHHPKEAMPEEAKGDDDDEDEE